MIQDDVVFSSGDEAKVGMMFTRGSRVVSKAVPPKGKKVTKRGRGDSVLQVARGKKRKVEPLTRKAIDSDTLFAKYAPTTTADLVTTPIPTKAVMEWMVKAKQKSMRSKVLFVHGPSGCGKRTLVEYAARSAGFSIRRWVPTDTNYHNGEASPTTCHAYFSRALLFDRNLSTEILAKSSTPTPTVLLFEGLPPNSIDRHHQQRATILQQFISELDSPSTRPELPVIFLFTTHNTHSTKHQLHSEYPEAFLASQKINTIELKPVTDTQLKKRLLFISQKELSSKQEAATVVRNVLAFSGGDIRQAMHDLAFRLICPVLSAKKVLPFEVREATHLEDGSDDIANQPMLNIGHATARVLSAKRDKAGNLEHSLMETLQRAVVNADKFTDYIHYTLPRYSQVDDGVERMASVVRRMSEANTYGGYLSRKDRTAGWMSSCLFRWSVDKHMLSSTPSRSTGFQQCNPPPFFHPVEAQSVLRKVIAPSIHPEDSMYYPSTALCLDLCPMLGRMVLKTQDRAPFSSPIPRSVPFVSRNRPVPFVSNSKPVPYVPNKPQPFVPSNRPQPFVSSNKPQPFAPSNKPQPFVPKPQPFVPSNRPQPFVPAALEMNVVRNPIVHLTMEQVQHLAELRTYSTRRDFPIAGKWEKPPSSEKELRDPRVLIAKHAEETLQAVEDPSDPIQEF
eukprot:TRINITY_DN1224_c0_g1_i1.p1 TRINITY_DN1224_c0_g1~~TRINITY_DN1224_c0_g1_i1.p1  ORF type:complete len:676 (+),score=92.92 TRINITY_DN1224_c0_g1_i1:1161-3188(+)